MMKSWSPKDGSSKDDSTKDEDHRRINNNATTGMMAEMKKIFDEKIQNLVKENSLLKEQVTKKEKTENVQSEGTH